MEIPWKIPPDAFQGLKFRLLNGHDFQALFEAASDPLIWEMHPDRLRYTKEGFSVFFEKALSDQCQPLLLLDERNEKVIGSSRYYEFDDFSQSVFIGFTFLTREYWGGVWNSRLKLAMLSHAFRFCDTVFFEAGINNQRSVSALEKLGALRVQGRSPEKALFAIDRVSWPVIKKELQEKLGFPDLSTR
jgi:hypothetical protein